MRIPFLLTSLATLCAINLPLQADTKTGTPTETIVKETVVEHEQHGTHEHGVARLTLAVSDAGLEIALESPAANVFGFEHAPSTDEEKATLVAATAKLEDGASLFKINPEAECALVSADIEAMTLQAESEAKETDHDHDHAEHQHADKTDHAEQEDGHEHAEQTHSDVDGGWVFACKKPEAIQTVTTGIFAAFPAGFQKLQVEWVNGDAVSAQELTEDATITLK